MDSFFSPYKIFVHLYERSISCGGPVKGKRPDKENARKDHSWPFQTYTTYDTRFIPKGWKRVAWQKVKSGAKWFWVQASVWYDTKIVKKLSTTFMDEDAHVNRWVHSERQRKSRSTTRSQKEYGDKMDAVDRADCNMAYFKIGSGKCKKRFHRTIFFWVVSAVLHNVFVALEYYLGDEKWEQL